MLWALTLGYFLAGRGLPWGRVLPAQLGTPSDRPFKPSSTSVAPGKIWEVHYLKKPNNPKLQNPNQGLNVKSIFHHCLILQDAIFVCVCSFALGQECFLAVCHLLRKRFGL